MTRDPGNVFKIATVDSRVRRYLTAHGWEFRGRGEEMEMDAYRERKTGKLLSLEDISEDFPVTFLMGELSLVAFRKIAHDLTPKVRLLEVESSWEGRPTTIVVSMTEDQVRSMFGERTKMKRLQIQRVTKLNANARAKSSGQ